VKFGSKSSADSGASDTEMTSAKSTTDVNVSNAERGEFMFCLKLVVSECEEIGSVSAVGWVTLIST
jgi:hypothetical protein